MNSKLHLLDHILLAKTKENQIAFFSVYDTSISNGILLEEYLLKNHFTHFIKSEYTEEELQKILNVICQFEKSCDKLQVRQASLVASSWWRGYYSSPTLESTSLLKSYFLILIKNRYTDEIINSIEVMNQFEEELRSILQVQLLLQGEIDLSLEAQSDILDHCLKKANYQGNKKGNVRMVVTKENVTVYVNECPEVIYQYFNSKTKQKK